MTKEFVWQLEETVYQRAEQNGAGVPHSMATHMGKRGSVVNEAIISYSLGEQNCIKTSWYTCPRDWGIDKKQN